MKINVAMFCGMCELNGMTKKESTKNPDNGTVYFGVRLPASEAAEIKTIASANEMSSNRILKQAIRCGMAAVRQQFPSPAK